MKLGTEVIVEVISNNPGELGQPMMWEGRLFKR